jgi:hypothetical protein
MRGTYRLPEEELTASFWSVVDLSAGLDGCWIWTGHHSAQGSPAFSIPGMAANRSAIRFAYTLAHERGAGRADGTDRDPSRSRDGLVTRFIGRAFHRCMDVRGSSVHRCERRSPIQPWTTRARLRRLVLGSATTHSLSGNGASLSPSSTMT